MQQGAGQLGAIQLRNKALEQQVWGAWDGAVNHFELRAVCASHYRCMRNTSKLLITSIAMMSRTTVVAWC